MCDRDIVDRNDFEFKRTFRGQRAIARDDADHQCPVGVHLGDQVNLHLIAGNVDDGDVLVLHQRLIAGRDGIAVRTAKIVVHVDDGQGHIFLCVFQSGLIVVKIEDLRLVVDRRNRDGHLCAAGERRPGLIRNGDVEDIRAKEVCIRHIGNRVVGVDRCGAVLRRVGRQNRLLRRVAVRLAVRSGRSKRNLGVLIDRSLYVVYNGSIVHRRHSQVDDLFVAIDAVAHANDDFTGSVCVCRSRNGDGRC